MEPPLVVGKGRNILPVAVLIEGQLLVHAPVPDHFNSEEAHCPEDDSAQVAL